MDSIQSWHKPGVQLGLDLANYVNDLVIISLTYITGHGISNTTEWCYKSMGSGQAWSDHQDREIDA